MRWATRSLIHFDRVISAWLIRRFIDPEATFVFLSQGVPVPPDVTPFGLPGANHGAHDNDTSTFQHLLTTYSIRDSALAEIGGIVSGVVAHVMQDANVDGLQSRDARIAGLLTLAEGIMLVSATDDDCLERSLPLYDALYARIQAHGVMARVATAASSTSVLQQTLQFAHATAALRAVRAPFSPDAFARALRDPQ